MKNYVQPGDVITVTAPYALTSGQGCLVGGLFGVAASDAAISTPVEIKTQGVFDVTALTADVAAVGAVLYWDNAARRLTTTVSTNKLVGAAIVAKTGTDTTARIRLNGIGVV